jgi:hypothetical protein
MKQKFLMLKAIDSTPLQLAKIRSLLAELIYIEIDNSFIVSCSKSFKDVLATQLDAEVINYIIIYVNLKAGCDVFANGIDDNDKKNIEKIVIDQ